MTALAQYGLIFILSGFLILHLLILVKLVPYTMVWGGRLTSDTGMYRFEVVSIFLNLFFLFVVLVQSGILHIGFPKKGISISLWAMAVLFLLNTLGNITSKNKLERRLFTPITVVLTVFSILLALAS